MSPGTRTGSWYRPSAVYWSCCWVTQGIMVWLLVIDFQRGRSHFPTVDVIIYSAISLQLGFHLSWFLPTAVDALLAVAPRLTVKSVKASLSYCFKVLLGFFLFLFFVCFVLFNHEAEVWRCRLSFVSVVGQDKEPGVFFNAQARAWLRKYCWIHD